jgi:hypothetical protein
MSNSKNNMSIMNLLNHEEDPPSPASLQTIEDVQASREASVSTEATSVSEMPSKDDKPSDKLPIRRKRSPNRGNSPIEPYSSFNPSAKERERREFRPTYTEAETHFIWYHRIDLNLDWAVVKNLFNKQFPGRQRRGFQGIQCKYYRCLDNHGLPPVRARNKMPNSTEQFGIRTWLPDVKYTWMRDLSKLAVILSTMIKSNAS